MRTIDLFAGWGGFTVGAEQAGAKVVYAANHSPLCVQAHQLNHPTTQHACQDLRQADWTALPEYDLMLAAPACQGFSSASQPKRRAYHNAMRATGWAVIDCAEVTRPRAIIVENVPQFRSGWELYRRWRQCLEDLGYRLSEHLIMASHYGVPQRRQRLFIVGMLDQDFDARFLRTPEPAFGPCIDWSSGDWRPLSKASRGAQRRFALARERHGDRCLVQHVSGHKGISLDEPIRTITCQDQWAVLDGEQYRPLTVRENARGMGFPDHYGWPQGVARRDAIVGLGNAVCPPVAKMLVGRVADQMGMSLSGSRYSHVSEMRRAS